jgi:hypothetical protein
VYRSQKRGTNDARAEREALEVHKTFLALCFIVALYYEITRLDLQIVYFKLLFLKKIFVIMMRSVCFLVALSSAMGFAPFASLSTYRSNSIATKSRSESYAKLSMVLGVDEKVIVIGVAADSGCGKSTFMRRLTKVFGGKNVGPLGGGFGTPGGWETNTLVSDVTTVLCLDDYHLNDRGGRKVSGLTALNIKEQRFDLMYEHIKALKVYNVLPR